MTLDVDREPERNLGDIPNVRDIDVDDKTVRGTCVEPAAKLRFIDRVRELTTVTDVRIEESSLEDLFASYTGEDTTDSQTETVVPGGVA